MKARLLAVALGLAPQAAHAEIALLSNGQCLKVGAHEVAGEAVRLVLAGGGEVRVPATLLLGFVPDEVVDEVSADLRPADLRHLAASAARRQGLDPNLVLAVVAVESDFRPGAVSPKGAEGLMQIMPATAASLGVQDALDPASNLEGGTRHLKSLVTQYRGDLRKALAAYNAGAGAVELFQGVPPYPETRDYVERVLRRYRNAP